MNHKGILTVVSGFSGAGKGTLMKLLVEKYDNFALSVSMTTRAMREGEEEGVSYFFRDRESFEREIASGGLIEYAQYCGNYYGTPRKYVEEKLAEGLDVILEIEIQGAMQVKEQYPDCLLLFVMPPSIAELERRLISRGTESREVIRARLERAYEESKGIEAYDYIVINDDASACAERIHALVESAGAQTCRQKDFICKIREELKEYREVNKNVTSVISGSDRSCK